MQRLIILLGCVLALSLSWANLSMAQPEAALQEGRQKAAAGDIKGALEVYESLTRSHPDSHDAFAHLGGMQLLDQRYADAVKSFQRAISLGDDQARPFVGMGMAYLHLGQYSAARAAFVEARARGVANGGDIDGIIHWIDTRTAGTGPMHP